MIAVDGSELDAPLAATARRLFGPDADYWAVNVNPGGPSALASVPTTFPAMYGGSLVGFGGAYPYVAPYPYQVRDADGEITEEARAAAEATSAAVADEAGLADADVVAAAGDPPEAILHAAHEHDIDVVVVGDHDRGWWSTLVSPAVGKELVDRAEIPVLVVSRDAAARHLDGGEAS
jgi:nucleotide-binding universal stress UspA family protein